MNAQTAAGGYTPSSAAQTYSCTFGHYTQLTWSDVRELTWPELTDLLTQHEIGRKEGTCIVPAMFSGARRHKGDAVRIEVILLDSDTGATLSEITAAICRHGWSAIVSSTHSHLTTRTRAKRGNWDRFRVSRGNSALLALEFLKQQKSYPPQIVEGARVVTETDEFVTFEHQPCPKFRIAIPLLRPWLASSYDDQRTANAAWKERIEALAGALGLSHDQACTDTSRLFYLPRRPADSPAPETAVLDGTPCDIFVLPRSARAKPRPVGAHQRSGRGHPTEYLDPDTGEVFNLGSWIRCSGQRFEIVDALRARRPEIFVGKVADGTKHHIRCVNDNSHTDASADAATIVINASESTTRGFVYHCRHGHCDGLDRLFFLQRMLEQRWLTPSDLNDARFLSGVERPVIRLVGGEIADIVDAAQEALLKAALDVYQRGAFVVRPGLVSVSVTGGRKVSAQRILEIGEHALVEALTVAAAWEKYDARAEDWVRIDAPLKVASTLQQRVGRWKLPILTGLIDVPTLRADGSILSQPGYDSSTGLLLDTRGMRVATIPGQPTHEDAATALAVLDAVIETFPFVEPASRAVALSAILTACIRRSLATAPMHGFTAPTAGSGKSMLVDLISIIATGREAGVIAQGKTEEELEKRLGALLLAGDQVIAIDNCEGPLGGEFLCSMLTQTVVRPRILGRSEAPELPANAMVTATGNNLVLTGDMVRRAVLCRLDPREERPELRTFATDPLETAKSDRGRYLVAGLTVLRAYHIAGRPNPPAPLGSFKEWSNWVRGALIWLGQADPVDTMEGTRDLDPKLDMLIAVVTQWQAVLGTRSCSVRDIIEAATHQHAVAVAGSMDHFKPEFLYPDFREALLAVAGDGGAVNSRRLGKWLAANQDRIVQKYRIVRGGLSAGILRWRLEALLAESDRGAV